MLGNLRLAHDFAGERLANLDVVTTNRLGIDPRVEGRNFPDVSDAKSQTFSEVRHTGRIQVTTALALHNEHERQNRRSHYRILREMSIDLRLHFRREARRLAGDIHRLR